MRFSRSDSRVPPPLPIVERREGASTPRFWTGVPKRLNVVTSELSKLATSVEFMRAQQHSRRASYHRYLLDDVRCALKREHCRYDCCLQGSSSAIGSEGEHSAEACEQTHHGIWVWADTSVSLPPSTGILYVYRFEGCNIQVIASC